MTRLSFVLGITGALVVAAPVQAFWFQTPSHNIACIGTKVLAYGQSKLFGPFRCTSRTSGLRCQNRVGHGWFLSRARQSLF